MSGKDRGFVRVEVASDFRLYVDGVEVHVSRPQVRTVLALLATSRNASPLLLIEDALWPDAIPSNPGASLRTLMSRTRTALGDAAHRLRVSGDSYQLEAESDWIEVEDLAASPEVFTTANLADILDRTEGVPFSNLIDSDVLVDRCRRFERHRAHLQRHLVRQYVAEGNDSAAVQRALAILDSSPEDESLACEAAMAFARLGRKAKGIELLTRTRSTLVSHGLGPSEKLLAIEQTILLDAHELAESKPTLPSDPTFIGRQLQLDTLDQLQPGRCIYVEGESGIGKTALLQAYSERCADDGIAVIRCQGSATATSPMSAVTQIVEGLLDLRGVEVGEDDRAAVAKLVPHRVDADRVPASRESLVSGLVRFIVTAVGTAKVVLAFDDAQWIDLASALVVQALLRSEECRVLLLARPHNLERVLGEEQSRASRVVVGPLTAEESDALIEFTLAETTKVDAAALHRRSGGNPLFLQMLLDLLEQEIDVEGELPPMVLVAVQRRMEALSRESRRVLQTAAVIGASFEGKIVKSVEVSAEVGLDEAQRAGLIERQEPGEVYTFRHALVADAAYQLLGEADRIALHDQVSRLVEVHGADPIVIFHHSRQAARIDPWRASELAVRAARQHLDAFDWEAAVETANWGLEQGGDPDHRLLIAKAQGELALGVPNSQFDLIEGARLARQAGDASALVEAVIEICNSGSAALTGLDVSLVRRLVEAALPVADEEGRLDELRAAAARAFVYSSHGRFGQDLYAQAFRNVGSVSRPVRELILRNSEAGLSNPKDFALAQRATMLLSEAADHNPELVWLSRWFQYRDALIAGDGDRLAWALRDLRTSAAGSERRHAFVVLGQTFDMEMQRSWAESTIALIHEDFDLAEQCAEEALNTGLGQLAIRGDGFGEDWVMASYGLLLLAIRHGQGRLAELVDVVETSAPLVPAWRVAIVIANHAAGNTNRVQDELRGLTADGFAALVPDPTWTAAAFLLAEPVAEFCDVETAEQLYRLISPYQDRMSFSGLCTFGPMHEACATLAGALGRDEERELHQKQGEQLLERLRTRSNWGFDELRRS